METRSHHLFLHSPASRLGIFSLFQVDLTNLFDINRILAVKLNQSFNSLYELPYYEYMYYLKLLINENNENLNEVFELEPNRPA